MRNYLAGLLTRAIEKTSKAGDLSLTEIPPLVFELPKQREFGDLATNIAMHWARTAKKPPRLIADAIVKNIEDPEGILQRIDIAGPGFLNFTFSKKFYYQRLRDLVAGKDAQLDLGHGKKVQIEFASVNPTGPLHVGHGRVAVIGDVLARLHEATGFNVEREYYVNDAGNQMENLGLSVYARYRELFGDTLELPEGGYPGEYVKDIAAEIKHQHGDKFLSQSREAAVEFFRRYGGDSLLHTIRQQLSAFDIRFDSFFSEKAMRERGEIAESIRLLRERGLVYSQRWR